MTTKQFVKTLWNNRSKIVRHRRVKKGVKAIVEAYNAGDFKDVSYGTLEKYGIADMSVSKLGEPEFIFDGTNPNQSS
jgi:hypothetical protein